MQFWGHFESSKITHEIFHPLIGYCRAVPDHPEDAENVRRSSCFLLALEPSSRRSDFITMTVVSGG